MRREPAGIAERAAELRRAFDRSFSEPPRTQASEVEDLLAIRVGHDPYAVRLADVSGLFADKTVTPLPGSLPELIGIAGFRGAIVPVYDLPALLGYSSGGAPRWLVLAAAPTPVGLAFDHFEGHLRVPRRAIAADEGAEIGRQYVREVVRIADVIRPIVRLASVLDAIAKRIRQGNPQKEG